VLFFDLPHDGAFTNTQYTFGIIHPTAIDRHLDNPFFNPMLAGFISVVKLKGFATCAAATSLKAPISFPNFDYLLNFAA
jgi:hypothetical protein